jgi:hypothetical protein
MSALSPKMTALTVQRFFLTGGGVEDAADDNSIGEHVVVLIVPFTYLRKALASSSASKF